VAEHYLNAASHDGQIIWGANVTSTPTLIHTLQDATSAISDTAGRVHYRDVHSWTFSPASFRLLMDDLFQLGFVTLREIGPAVSGSGEFYIKLSRSGAGPQQDRLDLARVAARER